MFETLVADVSRERVSLALLTIEGREADTEALAPRRPRFAHCRADRIETLEQDSRAPFLDTPGQTLDDFFAARLQTVTATDDDNDDD